MTQVLKEECPLNKKMMLHRLLLLLDLDIGKENVVEWRWSQASLWIYYKSMKEEPFVARLREAILQEKCSFFNIVQKAFDPPPPFRLNIMWWIFWRNLNKVPAATFIDKLTRKSVVKMSNLD